MSIYENVSQQNDMIYQPMQPCPITVDTKLITSTGGASFTQAPTPAIKAPVFLKRVNLRVTIVDDVKFPDLFLEIKEIKKKCILTQTKIVFDTLVVEGFVLKNISYVSPQIGSDIYGCHCAGFKNNFHDIEVRVPFHATMELPDDVIAKVTQLRCANANRDLNFNFKCNTMKDRCCDTGTMGPSLCEEVRVQSVFLNEMPFGDLVGYFIYELDINRRPCGTDEHLFEVLTEKMAVCLTIDLYMEGWATVVAVTPIPPQCDVTPTTIP